MVACGRVSPLEKAPVKVCCIKTCVDVENKATMAADISSRDNRI